MSENILEKYLDIYEEEFLFVSIQKVEEEGGSEDTLKCLKLINNKTIIQWQLEVFEALNIPSIQIIIDSQHEKILKTEIEKMKTSIKIDYYIISQDNLFGNESGLQDAVALREFVSTRGKEFFSKYKNVVFIPGELLFDVKTMTEFINKHRLENSYMTLLTTEENRKPNERKDFFVVNDKGNIFSMKYASGKSGENRTEKMTIPFNFFVRYPSLKISENIQSMKTFIIRTIILKRLKTKEEAVIKSKEKGKENDSKVKYSHLIEMTSIHKQLIPYIIKLLISKDGQDIKQTSINDLCNHLSSPFEPPCIYYTQTTGSTVIVTKENVDELNEKFKESQLNLF